MMKTFDLDQILWCHIHTQVYASSFVPLCGSKTKQEVGFIAVKGTLHQNNKKNKKKADTRVSFAHSSSFFFFLGDEHQPAILYYMMKKNKPKVYHCDILFLRTMKTALFSQTIHTHNLSTTLCMLSLIFFFILKISHSLLSYTKRKK